MPKLIIIIINIIRMSKPMFTLAKMVPPLIYIQMRSVAEQNEHCFHLVASQQSDFQAIFVDTK